MAVNPQNAKSIYAGNMARTVFRTVDGGATWEELAIRSPEGTSTISCLYVHPVDTTIVFAGGSGLDGLERSTDAGITWQPCLRDPQGFRMEFVGESVIAHPTAADTMYAIRNSPGTLYRSTDFGATWDSLSSPGPAAGGDRFFRSITVAPDSTNVILLGGYSTFIHRSTDGGRTFVKDPVATRTGTVGGFRWSTITPGTVYASVQFNVSRASATPGGVWQSTDWGATWTVIGQAAVSLLPIEVYPNDVPGGADVIFVGGNNDNRSTQAQVGDSLVYRSADGGITWADFSDVPWTENEYGEANGNVTAIKRTSQQDVDVVLLASESGVFMSSLAATIAPSHSNAEHAIVIRTLDDGTLDLRGAMLDGRVHVEWYSVEGRRITAATAIAVDERATVGMPHVQAGVYLLSIRSAGQVSTARFVRY